MGRNGQREPAGSLSFGAYSRSKEAKVIDRWRCAQSTGPSPPTPDASTAIETAIISGQLKPIRATEDDNG